MEASEPKTLLIKACSKILVNRRGYLATFTVVEQPEIIIEVNRYFPPQIQYHPANFFRLVAVHSVLEALISQSYSFQSLLHQWFTPIEFKREHPLCLCLR